MRLRNKYLIMFLAVGLFPVAASLAASYSLRVVGRDVDHLQIYTQADDICGQIKAELSQMPDLDTLSELGMGGLYELIDKCDRALVLCQSLRTLTTNKDSQEAIARVEAAVLAYRGAGKAYALAKADLPDESHTEKAEQAAQALAQLESVAQGGVIGPIAHEAHLEFKKVVDRADFLNKTVTVGGLSLSLLCTLIAAIVLARATARPIVRLVRAARQIGEGNLNTQVPVPPEDELQVLGKAFNDMTRQLRDYYDGLEEEVRKRTTELRQREKDLERERRLAAIGRLAAGVAHEVSNPLTVIAGAAEGLRDRAQDEALQQTPAFEDFPEYLEAIESEAYRLKKVVRRLLDFSRSKPTLMSPLDLRDVLNDAVQLARLDPRAKAGTTVEHEDGGHALEILGDADALQEAILNLLFNALSAIDEAGEVRVRTGQGGGRVFVEVSDTGMGIDPADQERIFEPFFTTRKEGEGTGLGLSLVYETAGRHGGTITCRSDGPGTGATFRLTLPERGDAATLRSG